MVDISFKISHGKDKVILIKSNVCKCVEVPLQAIKTNLTGLHQKDS